MRFQRPGSAAAQPQSSAELDATSAAQQAPKQAPEGSNIEMEVVAIGIGLRFVELEAGREVGFVL
jgi:hypothetical protein